MWALPFTILKSMLLSLATKGLIEWAVKSVVVSLLEEAVNQYQKSAAKTQDKADDIRARRASAALNKVKEIWGVDDEEK